MPMQTVSLLLATVSIGDFFRFFSSVLGKKECLIFVLVSFFFGGSMAYSANLPKEALKSRHIVLLGASIGYAWKIAELPKRIEIKGYTFEYVGEDGFDKSQTLIKILSRPNRPEAIFLKECAAYFPGDIAHYQNLMKKWVEDCRKAGVIPILVTVVPVRDPSILKLQYWKNIVKKIIYPGKPTVEARLRDLTAFNDWVRKYASEQKLALLDLEEALRISESDRRLRPDFDGGDGLHLNAEAYIQLDKIVMPTLEKVDWNRVRKGK